MMKIPVVYGLPIQILRSGLALTFLLLLLFSDMHSLIRSTSDQLDPLECNGIDDYTVYCIFGQTNIIYIKLVGILSSLWVLSGVFIQIGFIFFWWNVFSFWHIGSLTDGGDQVLLSISTLCLVASLFDKRINSWRHIKYNGALASLIGWTSFLAIKIQMSVIYLNSGLEKLKLETWRDGSEVYYALNSPIFGGTGIRLSIINFFMDIPLVLLIITWGTIVLEVFIGVTILLKVEYKKLALVFMLLLHGLIAVFMGIPIFSFVMIVCAWFSLLPSRALSLSSFSGIKNQLLRQPS